MIIKKNAITFGFDADGVLFDFNKAAKDIIEKLTQYKFDIINPNAFGIFKQLGLGTDAQRMFWKNFHWEDLPPKEGAIEALNLVRDGGYKICILTSMNPNDKINRINNLKKYGMKYDEVIVCKRRVPKTSALKEIKPLFYIDDQRKNIQAAIDAGVPNIGYIAKDIYDSENVVSSENVLTATKTLITNIS